MALESREQVIKLCEALYDKKALDIRAINVADKTIVAEWFVVCSGRATTQVRTLCDELEDKAAELELSVIRKEGYGEGRWIVIDFGHILVHIFHPEEREFYNMERLWDDDPAKCINFSKEKGE
ncbi:MAG: ribosome silencing factor [Clostridia bacterium]|nr:ribosome silencing factor [Clostridia bacterium]